MLVGVDLGFFKDLILVKHLDGVPDDEASLAPSLVRSWRAILPRALERVEHAELRLAEDEVALLHD